MNIEKEAAIKVLIEKQIPFVIFSPPHQSARMVITYSQSIGNSNDGISERGFYAFPFHAKEHIPSLYFHPDLDIPWNDWDGNLPDLPSLNAEYAVEMSPYIAGEQEYLDAILSYKSSFESEEVQKAIYSRISLRMLDSDFNIVEYFDALLAKYPKAFTYMMFIPGNGIWIGVSPELLLSYRDRSAKTVALAGTLPKVEGQEPNWSEKEVVEHRLVEDHITTICNDLGLQYEKSKVRTSDTGKVYHRKSDFDITISSDRVHDLLSRLHPTPAISGLPQSEALDLIYTIEKHRRTYYCGYLGWVESPEDLDLYINLRCMRLAMENNSAYLYAGGGITADSIPEKEWIETELKMGTLSDLFPKEPSIL